MSDLIYLEPLRSQHPFAAGGDAGGDVTAVTAAVVAAGPATASGAEAALGQPLLQQARARTWARCSDRTAAESSGVGRGRGSKTD